MLFPACPCCAGGITTRRIDLKTGKQVWELTHGAPIAGASLVPTIIPRLTSPSEGNRTTFDQIGHAVDGSENGVVARITENTIGKPSGSIAYRSRELNAGGPTPADTVYAPAGRVGRRVAYARNGAYIGLIGNIPGGSNRGIGVWNANEMRAIGAATTQSGWPPVELAPSGAGTLMATMNGTRLRMVSVDENLSESLITQAPSTSGWSIHESRVSLAPGGNAWWVEAKRDGIWGKPSSDFRDRIRSLNGGQIEESEYFVASLVADTDRAYASVTRGNASSITLTGGPPDTEPPSDSIDIDNESSFRLRVRYSVVGDGPIRDQNFVTSVLGPGASDGDIEDALNETGMDWSVTGNGPFEVTFLSGFQVNTPQGGFYFSQCSVTVVLQNAVRAYDSTPSLLWHRDFGERPIGSITVDDAGSVFVATAESAAGQFGVTKLNGSSGSIVYEDAAPGGWYLAGALWVGDTDIIYGQRRTAVGVYHIAAVDSSSGNERWTFRHDNGGGVILHAAVIDGALYVVGTGSELRL